MGLTVAGPHDLSGISAVGDHSAAPLYQQVRDSLEEWAMRELGDDPLPSEQELADVFGVSKITIRQALSILTNEGILQRRRPRGPLFLAHRRVHQHLLRLHGFFTDDLLTAGMHSRTTVLHQQVRQHARAALLLDLEPESSALEVRRLHIGNDTPMAIQTSYLPMNRFPGIDTLDLSGSLLALIEDHYGVSAQQASQRIRCRSATAQERTRLLMSMYAWVIELERISIDHQGTPLEYFICVLPADRYDFTMTIDRHEAAEQDMFHFTTLSIDEATTP